MSSRYPQLVLSGLGACYGTVQFLEGLSQRPSWAMQMARITLAVVCSFLLGHLLRHPDSWRGVRRSSEAPRRGRGSPIRDDRR